MKYSHPENQCANLNRENASLKSELAAYRSSSSKRHNRGEQYSRRNSLIAERLRNVPKGVHGTQFSMYVAEALNNLIPDLSLTHHDIDTSHVLYYEWEGTNCYPAVVIKFVSRDLRNDILKYYRNGHLNDSVVRLSEHLTKSNRMLFESAQEIYHDDAWTEQCKIFVNDHGRKREIVNESDLVSPTTTNPSSNVDMVQAPFSSNTGIHGDRGNNPRHNPHRNRRPQKKKPQYNRGRNKKYQQQHLSKRLYSQTAQNNVPLQWPRQHDHTATSSNFNQHQNNNQNVSSRTINDRMNDASHNNNPPPQMHQSTMCNPTLQTPNYYNSNLPPLRLDPPVASKQKFTPMHNNLSSFNNNLNNQFSSFPQFTQPQFPYYSSR